MSAICDLSKMKNALIAMGLVVVLCALIGLFPGCSGADSSGSGSGGDGFTYNYDTYTLTVDTDYDYTVSKQTYSQNVVITFNGCPQYLTAFKTSNHETHYANWPNNAGEGFYKCIVTMPACDLTVRAYDFPE